MNLVLTYEIPPEFRGGVLYSAECDDYSSISVKYICCPVSVNPDRPNMCADPKPNLDLTCKIPEGSLCEAFTALVRSSSFQIFEYAKDTGARDVCRVFYFTSMA